MAQPTLTPDDLEILAERMAAKVAHAGACWIWQGAPTPDGYGSLRYRGRNLTAHRVAYQIARGQIPSGRVIDHKCRVRLCVNPDHLAVSTDKLNAENRSAAGRGASGVRGVYKTPAGRWGIRVKNNGRVHSGGSFATLEEASKAVRELRLRIHTNNLCDRATP